MSHIDYQSSTVFKDEYSVTVIADSVKKIHRNGDEFIAMKSNSFYCLDLHNGSYRTYNVKILLGGQEIGVYNVFAQSKVRINHQQFVLQSRATAQVADLMISVVFYRENIGSFYQCQPVIGSFYAEYPKSGSFYQCQPVIGSFYAEYPKSWSFYQSQQSQSFVTQNTTTINVKLIIDYDSTQKNDHNKEQRDYWWSQPRMLDDIWKFCWQS